jgi:iron complex transport system substrate-binding protein
MIRVLGAMVGCSEKGEELADRLAANLTEVQERARGFPDRPRIYFEEWSDPMISGIRWVSELVAYAGGEDCFPELSESSLAQGRIIEDPQEVVRRAPDIIIGSWCGRKFRPEKVVARSGWEDVPAVRDGHVYEIKSSIILQPGPAALTDGVAAIQELIERWTSQRTAEAG